MSTSTKIHLNEALKDAQLTIELKIVGINYFKIKLYIARVWLRILCFILRPWPLKIIVKKGYKYKIKGREITKIT